MKIVRRLIAHVLQTKEYFCFKGSRFSRIYLTMLLDEFALVTERILVYNLRTISIDLNFALVSILNSAKRHEFFLILIRLRLV